MEEHRFYFNRDIVYVLLSALSFVILFVHKQCLKMRLVFMDLKFFLFDWQDFKSKYRINVNLLRSHLFDL